MENNFLIEVLSSFIVGDKVYIKWVGGNENIYIIHHKIDNINVAYPSFFENYKDENFKNSMINSCFVHLRNIDISDARLITSKTIDVNKMIKCKICESTNFVKTYNVYVVKFNLTRKYKEINHKNLGNHLFSTSCMNCGESIKY